MKKQLYYFEECPFCKRVLRFIKNTNTENEFEFINTKIKENEDKLIEITGDDMVPCLVVDGVPLLESMKIIKWIDANLKNNT